MEEGIERAYTKDSQRLAQLNVLKFELDQLIVPLDSNQMTDRIDFYQKLEKVVTYNLGFAIQKNAGTLNEGTRRMVSTVKEIG